MKMIKIVSAALFSAFLAACGGSGGGNTVRPDPAPDPAPVPPPAPTPDPSPAPGSSLSEVPEQYRDIVSSAKTVPLTDDDDGDIYQFTLGGKTGEYNFSDLPNGVTNLPISMSYRTELGNPALASGTLLVYQQPYSVVIGETWTQDSGDNFEPDELNIFEAEAALGFSTPATALSALTAQNTIFNYKGSAFDGRQEATLNYSMNFGQREGSGSIEGFARTGLITLRPSTLLSNGSVRGDAIIENARTEPFIRYELSFFGPNAEELAGVVYDSKDEEGFLGESEIIFAGQR